MKNNTRKKLKQISVLLSMVVLSNKEIDSKELNNLLGKISTETFQEYDKSQYGNYLYQTYLELPNYLKKFLEDNLMHIVVVNNNDTIKKIYQDVYPDKTKINDMLGLTIADNLLAIVSGCLDYDNLDSLSYANMDEEDIKKLYLKYMMYHQIGHLIDIHFNNLSNTFMFMNTFYKNEVEVFLRFQYKFITPLVETNTLSIKPCEFFASSFACYIIQPSYFKRICPNTYKYIDKLVNEKLIINEKSK